MTMMTVPRVLESTLTRLAAKFPVLAITGPRQSGKTTLARMAFPEHEYVSLENPDTRSMAREDPRNFLAQFDRGAILDEVQRVPELFSYIQPLVDEEKRMGRFVMTGSQNFLLLQDISQTLAGRVAMTTLLPFSRSETAPFKRAASKLEDQIWRGFFPPVYDRGISPEDWYPNYLQTYIDKDVRQIKNVHDLGTFHRFLKMCAARAGQLVNFSSLANDCGVTYNTAKSWISLLETSYIVKQVFPHHRNYNKRLVKSPKLYFVDTGLLCFLLEIRTPRTLLTHSARGPLFENLVLGEILKELRHRGDSREVYFWRDKLGREVDFLVETEAGAIGIEAKSGVTWQSEYLKGLEYWSALAGEDFQAGYLVYAGADKGHCGAMDILPWTNLPGILFGNETGD